MTEALRKVLTYKGQRLNVPDAIIQSEIDALTESIADGLPISKAIAFAFSTY